MPLNREMSLDENCQAVERDRGSIAGEWKPTVRRALHIDQDVYFEHYAGGLWKRVKDYRPIRLGAI
jgi:hypothetical protein